MANNEVLCQPEKIVIKKLKKINDKPFGNLSYSIEEKIYYLNTEGDFESVKTQVEIMNNIRAVMLKEHEKMKKIKSTMMEKYDQKKSFYEALMNEKTKIIQKYDNKEIDEKAYKFLIEEFDSIFKKISFHFDENSETTIHEKNIRYFKPIFLKKCNLDFKCLINILIEWKPFKYNLTEPNRKELFLSQLKEYHNYVTQTESSILEKFENFHFWKDNFNNWKELSHLIIILMIQPPINLEKKKILEEKLSSFQFLK